MGKSATKSDSIDGHYVAQCVAPASYSVVQSVYAGAVNPSFAANFAVNKRRIHRKRLHQLVLGVRFGLGVD